MVSAQCATGLVSNLVLVNIEALGDQVCGHVCVPRP